LFLPRGEPEGGAVWGKHTRVDHHTNRVIDVDETLLRTIEQLQEFLKTTPEVAFAAHGEGGAAGPERGYA